MRSNVIPELQKEESGAATDSIGTNALDESACNAADASSPAAVVSPLSTDSDQGPKEGKKKKNRCLSCKKKVGLTGEFKEDALTVENLKMILVFLSPFQASPADAEGCSAQHTATVINTTVSLTIGNLEPRRYANRILSSWPRRCKRSSLTKKAFFSSYNPRTSTNHRPSGPIPATPFRHALSPTSRDPSFPIP